MKIAGEIIGVFAIIANFLIYQQKERKGVLKVKILSGTLWSIHYGLLSAFSGMAVCLVGATRDVTFLLTENKKQTRKYLLFLFAFISILTSALTMKNAYGLLPALASLIAVFSYWQQNPTVTKILGIPISISMLVYDVSCFSIMGIANETFTLISIAIFFIFTFNKTKPTSK